MKRIIAKIACKYGPRWWKRGTITVRDGHTTFSDINFDGYGFVWPPSPVTVEHCRARGASVAQLQEQRGE